MYKLVVTPSGKRSLKKLPYGVRKDLLKAASVLEMNPYAGEKLSGSLHFLYSFHFKSGNVDYRLAYTVEQNQKLVIVHFGHTRENFYDKLRRLFQ
ncbi:MAG: plasmid stabilization system protein [Parcubacteria group bacterium Gr01-1014_29]|nr:MAG: plasmid stabilization system protein [Parcubacteria group bacterium Gr01-1014_29]